MKDIAEHFGVSIATVSRALNGSERVSEEKRKIDEYTSMLCFYTSGRVDEQTSFLHTYM